MVALGGAAGVGWMAAWDGVPLTHGSRRRGCTCPGRPVSRTRRPGWRGLGGQVPADRDMPSRSWRPMVSAAAFGAVDVGEVAVGVEAVGQLVGQLGELIGAVLAARRANCASALARVSMSTKSGSRWQKPRMTATWPAPRSPLRCAAAVASSAGGSGSPLNARRWPRSAASWMRREASARLIAQPVGQCRGQFAAQFRGVGLLAELVDQRVLDGGQLAAEPFAGLQQGQPFGGGQRVERQIQGAFHGSLERVENLDDLFPATRTHVRILVRPPGRIPARKRHACG